MEVALYTAFTIISWLLSSSVLLPFIVLLHLNKPFRNKWFSFFYANFVSPRLGHKVIPNRKRAFKLLEEQMPERNKSVPLKVLEIGVGPGANFAFYPENSKLTAVDMNPSFQNYFLEMKKKYPHIDHEKTVICMAENMSGVDDSSMDVVVCTYVLCSVVDVKSVLREVKRVLKPGGKFLFLEHVAYQKHGWKYMLQRVISPLWKIYFDGCCPDKDTGSFINKAEFSNVCCEKTTCLSLWLYLRPHIIGIATK